jgi:hypothetical protein
MQCPHLDVSLDFTSKSVEASTSHFVHCLDVGTFGDELLGFSSSAVPRGFVERSPFRLQTVKRRERR